MRLAFAFLLATTAAGAQWTVQQSNTTADLRGIHALGNGVAWASGSKGTVLRTTNNGKTWLPCAVPPDAEALDFRGVQAFDAQAAIVMSSGTGSLSRLYRTVDGCQSWKLVFANPYSPEGFFDALLFVDPRHGLLFGDPSGSNPEKTPTEYAGNFRIRVTADGGIVWGPITAPDTKPAGTGLHALPGESAFAASNSAVAHSGSLFWFATSAGRISSRRLWLGNAPSHFTFTPPGCAGAVDPVSQGCGQPWVDFTDAEVPIAHGSASAGVFSLAFRDERVGVAVGGDYQQPASTYRVAAASSDGGRSWSAATTQPHGYRSSVAYFPAGRSWIAVGPNGTDVSADDGRNWRALRPIRGEPADADGHWNALSLPFVVGPHGRIGLLREGALKP